MGVERRDFIFWRVAGWKVEGELRFCVEGLVSLRRWEEGWEGVTVMRRVLEGSRGITRGGRSERSRESGLVG